MGDIVSNNKRIAKNTLFLYIRMLFLTLIGLITSRVILRALGIEDYGVYNAVGGFVAMFSFLTASLSNAISRYLTVAIGKSDNALLKDVFPTSINIQLLMSILVAFVIDVVGTWFLNSHMNIPPSRMGIANTIFHISIISFAISLIIVPFNAAVIAHEHMSFFAYIGIFDGVLKLLTAFLLYITPIDRLLTYSLSLCLIPIINLTIYCFYCRKHFEECHYRFVFKRNLFKEMFSFAGWSFLGSSSSVLNNYGVNVIINVFFGVTVNAARGVANQVDGILRQFVTSFTTAINPQIMKSYASGDFVYMNKLIRSGAKYSIYLLLLFAIPFWFETETILHIWLGSFPSYAPIFIRLTLLGILIDMSGNSLANAVWATGDVKKYYLIIGPLGLLAIPLSYCLFKLGYSPSAAYVSYIISYGIIQVVRLYIAKDCIVFNPKTYVKEVYLNTLMVSILPLLCTEMVHLYIPREYMRLLVVLVVSIVTLLLSIWLIGLSPQEKVMVKKMISQRIRIR